MSQGEVMTESTIYRVVQIVIITTKNFNILSNIVALTFLTLGVVRVFKELKRRSK